MGKVQMVQNYSNDNFSAPFIHQFLHMYFTEESKDSPVTSKHSTLFLITFICAIH
jgi:hypothetical protein